MGIFGFVTKKCVLCLDLLQNIIFAHLKSLQLFMLQSPCSNAVRFWSNPYSVDEIDLDNKTYKLHNMPYYYSGYLEEFMGML